MMQTLMNDLLDLAMMEDNSFKFSDQYFDLSDAMEDCINIVNFVASQKRLTLHSHFATVDGYSQKKLFY